jgi:hypothetical protein
VPLRRKTYGTGSEQLPHAMLGAVHDVQNTTLGIMAMQPAIGDRIHNYEYEAPYNLEPGQRAVFYCDEPGVWRVAES